MRKRDEKFPDNGFDSWGGYMQAKIAKLEEQFCNRADVEGNKLSNIFNGICIYVNGYTIPSADELKSLMSKHGGVYHTYQRNDDFIIASNLPDTKVKNMCLSKVVRPEWIIDSITSSRLLDYRDYLLYQSSRTQSKLNFVKNQTVRHDSRMPILKNKQINDQNLYLKQNKTFGKDILDKNKETYEGYSELQVTSHSASVLNNTHNNLKSPDKGFNASTKNEQLIKTAADPNFISEFYNNSRLHHISQLGACFKQYINDLRENSNFLFPLRAELKHKILTLNKSNTLSQVKFDGGKTIMHIDMDCFFVSVGLRKRPDLEGKPVAVTHSKGRQSRIKRPGVDRDTEFNLYKQKQAQKLGKGIEIPEEDIEIASKVDNIADEDDKFGSMSEIASCSYEARAKGITNGMFMGAALRLCPDLQTIPYDFEGYKEVAYTLYNTVAQYTLDIEAVSCDEMYVDCTELLKDMKVSVQDFATALRDEIKSKTNCPCSAGFGGNRLQARLATKRAKPDGQFFLFSQLVDDFIFNVNLEDLPGVGRQTAHKLESIGHITCGTLQSLSLATLQQHLGNKTGAQLYDQCRGKDSTGLTFYTVRKSVSAEVNYGIRFENNEQSIEFLKQLSAEVHSRMQQCKVLGKCITLKLMVRAEEAPVETAKFMGHGFCNVINKSISLNKATDNIEVITKEVISLYNKQKLDPKELRGVGIQVTKLELISNKQTKGTINKFLVNSKTKKLENNSEFESHQKLNFYQNECNREETTQPISPKKDNALSPKKKSPIMKLLSKRRGRPKSGFIKLSKSKNNLMNKFLHGQNIKDTIRPYPVPKKQMYEEKKPEEKPNCLIGLSWKKVREVLRAWLEYGYIMPLPCDVNMIAEYMRTMVVNKNIHEVGILLRFLRRRTREMCVNEWTEVCEGIVEHVQNAMIIVYGKKLHI